MSRTMLSLSPDRQTTSTAERARRRLADAEAEFDAAVQAALPMPVLVARDHEVRLATAAYAAARGVATFPTAGFAVR